MNIDKQPNLAAVLQQFKVEGRYVVGGPYGSGHINDTYAVLLDTKTGTRPYILQRVNHNIFKNVPLLMNNIQRATDHIRGKLEQQPGHSPDREALTVIPTLDNQPYLQDEFGNFWRAYIFIEAARTYDEVQSKEQVYQAAKAFGNFQKQLLDLPGARLHETIPDFHHTPKRFAALENAIDQDRCNGAAKAAKEIEFALARKQITNVLIDGFEAGRIPERITHNDTKINNVLLDEQTGAGICVIDLDTVMPGLVLYDFGDQVRTATCLGAEDEQDLQRVVFKLEMFETLVQGYLSTARDFLVPAEKEHLAFSGKLITFEIGIRFLSDYLDGDIYFKTHRPDHNLDRARVQFERARQMEEAEENMQELVEKAWQ